VRGNARALFPPFLFFSLPPFPLERDSLYARQGGHPFSCFFSLLRRLAIAEQTPVNQSHSPPPLSSSLPLPQDEMRISPRRSSFSPLSSHQTKFFHTHMVLCRFFFPLFSPPSRLGRRNKKISWGVESSPAGVGVAAIVN